MSPTLLPGLAALIGTLAGVLATYVVATRRSAGRIGTSEAADLWKASESIRRDLTEELRAVRAEVVELRAENVILRLKIAELEELFRRRSDA